MFSERAYEGRWVYDEAAKAIATAVLSIDAGNRWGRNQSAEAAFRPLGFAGATFFHFGHPTRGLNPRPLFGRPIPDAWMTIYQEQGLVQHDAAMALSLRSIDAFTWTEAEMMPAFAESAPYFEGARRISPEMLFCPMLADDGAAACVSLWMDEPRALGEMERAMAQSLAALFGTLGQRRLRPPPAKERRVKLSRRELQCIYWVANGKSDLEIGALLELSASTVHHYVESAKHKLEARTRIELVQRAAGLGLIYEPVLLRGYNDRGLRGAG